MRIAFAIGIIGLAVGSAQASSILILSDSTPPAGDSIVVVPPATANEIIVLGETDPEGDSMLAVGEPGTEAAPKRRARNSAPVIIRAGVVGEAYVRASETPVSGSPTAAAAPVPAAIQQPVAQPSAQPAPVPISAGPSTPAAKIQ